MSKLAKFRTTAYMTVELNENHLDDESAQLESKWTHRTSSARSNGGCELVQAFRIRSTVDRALLRHDAHWAQPTAWIVF